jgi:hypothetical protein
MAAQWVLVRAGLMASQSVDWKAPSWAAQRVEYWAAL